MSHKFSYRDNLRKLATELEAIRVRICPYPGPTCDCKYGLTPYSSPYSEYTGCPELGDIIESFRQQADDL
jgi:hypothetical protein